MAREALRLLAEPTLALRLARTARAECLSRYVWPAVRDEWERLYTGLTGRSAAGEADADAPSGPARSAERHVARA
jgi:hypothetical protein